MSGALQLISTGDFEGVKFDCYQDGSQEFWGTREQIGAMLGYADPRKAISNIHDRNKARLDRFSSALKLRTEAGERETTVYNFKGLLEICRYSNKPKADAVMDFLWNMADTIRRTGSYGDPRRELEPGKLDILGRLASQTPGRKVKIGPGHPFYWLIESCMEHINQARDEGFTWAQIEDALYLEASAKGRWQESFKKKKIREVYKIIMETDKRFAPWKMMNL